MTLIRPLVATFAGTLFVAAVAGAAPPGFAFLEVPAGTRASALGGASVASAAGADAAFWNPAGLADVQQTQITASHFEYIQGLRHDQFALAGQMFGGGIATSIRAMYSQAIDERDDVGNLIGSFGAHDLEFQLGYGWKTGTTRLGWGLQAVRERIADDAVTTWSGSAGGSWEPAALRGARVALAVQHLGPSARYTIDGQQGEPVALPASLQGGIAWHHHLGGMALDPEIDVRATRGRQAVVCEGAELTTGMGASLRVGLREGDDLANFSAGAGWKLGLFRVDYAWVPSRLELGDTHRFAVAAQF